MAAMCVSGFLLGVMFSLLFTVSSQRIRDKMYESIDGASACFRRLNGTHQFGCSSHRSGNVGIIHLIENETDLSWLLHNATVVPYMAVLKPRMFSRDVMLALKDSGKVNGVVLINNSTEEKPPYFSHEDTCPNRYSGLALINEQTCSDVRPWNPHGSGLTLVDWGFPIFHVSDEDTISKIYQCFMTHNAHNKDQQVERSLCALEMNSYMLAAVDSETCIRRSSATAFINRVRFCDPLGDRNIWATLYPRYEPEVEKNSVIVVAARLDGTSMFDGLVPGAVSPVAGIVTLLTTARILASLAQNTDLETQKDENVMFVLLNGESYDYIGSSRLVWDMAQGVFPMKHDPTIARQPPPFTLDNVALFVELGQISSLGKKSSNWTDFYVHQYEPVSNKIRAQTTVSSFLENMKEYGKSYKLNFTIEKSLPPSSLQSVLVKNRDTVGVVLADHQSQYINTYYHSLMDDTENLQYTYQNGSMPSEDSIQSLVANLSQTLALTLFKLINKSAVDKPPETDPKLVDKLLHCYMDTMDCPVFRAVSNKPKLDSKPASLYVGVNGWLSPVTTLTAQTLAFLMGHQENVTQEKCHNNASDRVYSYIWMHNFLEETNSSGVCVKTTMNYSLAISPAFFEIPDYDWSSGNYSTWTESIWREFSVRMFLKPSRSHETLTFTLGTVVLIFSILFVYFANSRSHILFGNTFLLSRSNIRSYGSSDTPEVYNSAEPDYSNLNVRFHKPRKNSEEILIQLARGENAERPVEIL